MRLLVILALLLTPLSFAGAITGGSARFDYSNGIPAVTDNQTSTCNNETTVRYDYAMGVPAPVYNPLATCTAAGGGFITPVNSIIWISED